MCPKGDAKRFNRHAEYRNHMHNVHGVPVDTSAPIYFDDESAFKSALLDHDDFKYTVFVRKNRAIDGIDTQTGDEYNVKHYRCVHSVDRHNTILDRIETALSGHADSKVVCTAYMTVLLHNSVRIVMLFVSYRRERGRQDRRKAASLLNITQNIMVTMSCQRVNNAILINDILPTMNDWIDYGTSSIPIEAIIYILRRLTTNSHLLGRSDKVIDIRWYIAFSPIRKIENLPTIANGFVIIAQRYYRLFPFF